MIIVTLLVVCIATIFPGLDKPGPNLLISLKGEKMNDIEISHITDIIIDKMISKRKRINKSKRIIYNKNGRIGGNDNDIKR